MLGNCAGRTEDQCKFDTALIPSNWPQQYYGICKTPAEGGTKSTTCPEKVGVEAQRALNQYGPTGSTRMWYTGHENAMSNPWGGMCAWDEEEEGWKINATTADL